ncbi:S24 family peptidase [Cohnella thermotolerans]|uniref:S24 family peptidase n=1 Tax=Cohnella thermotolerans TaxID=329858 RepID=UPI0006889521
MFPERLRQARKEARLTQSELASRVKTKKTTISNYETGYSTPSQEMLSDLADVLGKSTDWLLGRSDDPSPISAANKAEQRPRVAEQTTDYETKLPPDLLQLIETAKKLPPEERKALNEYLKVRLSFTNEISAAREITEAKRFSLVAETNLDYVTKGREYIYEIPLVGASAAGTPMTVIGYYEGNFRVPENWGDFALRVKGDSMEPLIPDNGFVFVRQQETISNNEIALIKVLGNLEDEVTIKRIQYRNNKFQLLSENPQYAPIEYQPEKIKILGKVMKWLSAGEGNQYLKEHI